MQIRKKSFKPLLISLIIIVLLVLLAIVLLQTTLKSTNSPLIPEGTYGLNQEIVGFPTTDTALTFTSWFTTQRFGMFEASETTKIVILNFTLKSIANTEINIRSNLQYFTDAAPFTPREAPLLKCEDYYAKAKTEIPYAHYWRLWTPQTTLQPNESISGCLLYEIPKEQTPTELLYPDQASQKIIIKLQE